MHARSKGVTADVLDRSARAPRVGAHALRVDAAMATRLRVAVVGQFSPPELIKINLDGDATSVRAALVGSRAARTAKFSRACGAPIEIAALRATHLISYMQ